MNKNYITLIFITSCALITAEQPPNNQKPQAPQTSAERCKQFADTPTKRDFIEKLQAMDSAELEDMLYFFQFILTEQTTLERGFWTRFALDAQEGNRIIKADESYKVRQSINDLEALLKEDPVYTESEKNSLIIHYFKGCQECAKTEIEYRKQLNDNFSRKDLKTYMLNLQFFKKIPRTSEN